MRRLLPVLALVLLVLPAAARAQYPWLPPFDDGCVANEPWACDNLAQIGNDVHALMRYEEQIPRQILSPTGGEILEMLDFGHRTGGATLTEIVCSAYGGGTIAITVEELDEDGSNAASVTASPITCTAAGTRVTGGTITNGSFDAEDRLRIVMGTPNGLVEHVSITLYRQTSP